LKDNNKKSKKVKNGDANAEVGRLVGTKHGVDGKWTAKELTQRRTQHSARGAAALAGLHRTDRRRQCLCLRHVDPFEEIEIAEKSAEEHRRSATEEEI